MIFLCNFAPEFNRYAHEIYTKQRVLPTIQDSFCTAQNRRKNADEKKKTSERKNTQMSFIFHLFFMSYFKHDFMLCKV